MKIVYCLPDTYKPGGIERVVSLKANYLADVLGYEVFIITTGQENNKPFYFFSNKIKFIDLGLNYDEIMDLSIISRIVKRYHKRKLHKKQLSELLIKLSPDITISTLTHEANILPGIKDKSKKVLEFHFSKSHKIVYARAFKFSRILKLAYYLRSLYEEFYIVNRYDQFVVLTDEDKESWKPFCKNVISIPNIVSYKIDQLAELDNKIVISIGRLDPQKGFDRLINIWNDIAVKYPEWNLNIFGSGPQQSYLESIIDKLGLNDKVRIFPPEKTVIKQYLNASIFVMTSRYEGMPMTLLEAGVCGLPSVVYDFKCGPKDVIINNENGFIVKENDSEEYVKKINLLIEDVNLRKNMGKKAAELSSRYSVDVVMEKWDKLFKDLLEK